MWGNQRVMRGQALIAVALSVGVQASRCSPDSIDRAGAGLFPLMVSGTLVTLVAAVVAGQAVARASCVAG